MKIKGLVPYLLALVLISGAISAKPVFAQQDRGEGELNPAKPNGTTVEDIIQRFAEKEKLFKQAREQYTWRQSVKVQTLEGDTVDGEYQSVVDIVFDDKGRRIEQVVFAPQNTLQRIDMSKEDFDDIEKRLPFVLTTDDIAQYDVVYVGQQRQDELNTYVFDIKPKRIDKGQRYFEGRIWVDDHDFQIVKTYGKSVPDLVNGKPVDETKKHKDGGRENFFPKFTTYREQIDGKYWFPTYTRVDDTLHFSNGDVKIRQIVKYSNYKRFASKVRITYEGQDIQGADQQPQQPGQQAPPAPPQQQPPPQQPPK